MDYSYPIYCSALRNGSRVALIGREEEVTFAELERRVAAVAAGLRGLGLGGSTVATLTGNDPETVELYLALARAGAVAVPLNTRLSSAEMEHILGDCGATAIAADEEFLAVAQGLATARPAVRTVLVARGADPQLPSLRQLRDTPPGPRPLDGDGEERAAATIIYTSGTTGFPKGVVRSHRANAWNVVNSALGAPRSPADVELFNLPAFGIGFLHFALPTLLGGASLVLDRGFDPERAWELLERYRVTRTFLAPTMIDSMLAVPGHEARDLGALETIYTAYAFPDRLRRAALARFGEIFAYMYGLTEAQLTIAGREEFAPDPSSVGFAMGVSEVGVLGPDGLPVAAGEQGEVAFAGPSLMSGYHAQPEATEEALPGDGWLRTGDLGRRDEAGALHYVGRSKEMIKTGGFSVDPLEVENAILACGEIAEAAVLGVESERWGEEVVAVLVLRADAVLDEASLLAACKERIASYKVPKRLVTLAELPKNPAGKVERAALRELVAAATS